jgi:hypothetical protein
MTQNAISELLGSNDQAVPLGDAPVTSEITLHPKPLADYAASYTAEAVARDKPGEPDRLFLKLRNVRGNRGACVFDVAVSVPGASAKPAIVGALGLFGLEYASDAKSEHGGGGLTKTFEITEEIDPYLAQLKQAGKIRVDITPRNSLGPGAQITVGKIDVYRLTT